MASKSFLKYFVAHIEYIWFEKKIKFDIIFFAACGVKITVLKYRFQDFSGIAFQKTCKTYLSLQAKT